MKSIFTYSIFNYKLKLFVNLFIFFLWLNPSEGWGQCNDNSGLGISTLNCADVLVNIPYRLNFDGNEGGILDKNNLGTGFRMVQAHSKARDVADGNATTSLSGYEPSKLHLSNGFLGLTANKGTHLRTTDNQINSLGVGIKADNQIISIETTLSNVVTGTNNAYAGLWYGLDEKNYVRISIINNVTIEFRIESANTSIDSDPAYRITRNGGSAIATNLTKLRLVIDNSTSTKTVKGYYKIGNNAEELVGEFTHNFASGITIGTENNVSFAGIVASYRTGSQFTANYDNFQIAFAESLVFTPASINRSVALNGVDNFSVSIATTNTQQPTATLLADEEGIVPTWLKVNGQVLDGSVSHNLSNPSINFDIDATGLSLGAHTAYIIANANGYDDDTLTLTVNVTPINLSFTPNTLNFTVQQGGTVTPQNIELVGGSGNPTITFSKSPNGSWVVIPSNPQFGTNIIGINAGGLSPGNYTAQITANADGYAPTTLTINLEVTPIIPVISSWDYKINFQPAATGVPATYLRDSGEQYALRTGTNQGSGLTYGWVNQFTNTPWDISDLARFRTGLSSVPTELKTLVQMQVTTRESKWEMQRPNGFYWVKISAGDWPDANAGNNHILNVEGTNILTFNQASTGTGGNLQATQMIEVRDGKLTVDAIGGTNTKINYIWITPVNSADDNVPPVVSYNFNGVENSPYTYRNQVTVTINVSDAGGSGLTSVEYSINNGAYQIYSTPLVFNTPNDYLIRVRAIDGNGNISETPNQSFKVIPYSISNTKLFVQNTTKFPDNDNYAFSFIQGDGTPLLQGPNYDYPDNFNYNHDSNVLRIHNYGTAPLVITQLILSDNINFKIDRVDGNRIGTGSGKVTLESLMPLVVAPGSYKDITLIFTARNYNATLPINTRKIFHETLHIISNDDTQPTKTVNLHGVYQQFLEGSNEPTAGEMIEVNGFKTQTGYTQNNPNHANPIADEVFSPYFVRADASKPVYVRQMAAYHGCCGSTEAIRWQPKSNGGQNNTIMTHFPKDGQTILPRLSNGGLGEATFVPTEAFSIRIAGDNTDPNRNTYQGTDANGNKYRGVRIWKAINWKGEIIPNAYIMSHDYLSGSANFDYNDNMYYIENIRPEVGTAYFSELASGTGVVGQANEKQSALEFPSTATNTNSQITLNLRSKGQTYANGTSDPDIIISKVEIVGQNLNEFLATMPADVVLSPQESTTLQVNFNPTKVGIKNAILQIYYNSADSPLQIPLFGLATSDCFNLTLTNRIKVGATTSANLVVNGKTWTPDLALRGSNAVVENANDTNSEILQTDADALYRSYLSTTGNGIPLNLNIPLTNNGKYLVRMHFAENLWQESGKRVNTIYLEGKLAKVGYDIYNQTGYKTATTLDFETAVADNILNIQFTPTTHRPAISGIEIYSLVSTSPMTITATTNGANCGTSTGSITATINNAQNGVNILYKLGEFGNYQTTGFFDNLSAGVYTVYAKEDVANGCEVEAVFNVEELNNNISFTVSTTQVSCGATSDGTATVSNITGGTAPYTIAWNTFPVQTSATATNLSAGNFTTVTITDATGCSKTETVTITKVNTCPIRINAAGPAYTTTDNKEFIADQYFNSGQTYTINRPIGNTNEDVLYQSERWNGSTLAYNVPVVNGNYQITLHFAEIYYTNAGQRRFHVNIEGTRVLTDFDIVATTGGRDIAVTRTFNASVADGTLTVEFLKGSNDNPKISAIEIEFVSAGGNNPPTVGTPIPNQTANIDLPFNFTVSEYTFIDADQGSNLTYSATLVGGGALPSWLSFNPTNRTFTGTPLEANLGTIQVVVKATDNQGASATDEFDIVVSKSAGSNVSFLKNRVTGLTISNPSSLQFGPDGRLYVSQVFGLIKAFTLQRTAPGQYTVTATEEITLVRDMPNYNDDGTPNPSVTGRQVLGLLVKGTPTNPILYVSSNDPRTGGGNGDLNLDTNSGIISKLFKNGSGQWEKIDLIRGLPKSEHNHATNGLQLDETTNTLYIAQGGHANKGAPSHELAWLPEYAYSAAILSADLNVIEAMPIQGAGNNKYQYDLPTLTGVGPFGGNNGLNQAVLVQGGPVQVYSPGFRNAYDIVITEIGEMYSWDNSSNAGWGLPPIARKSDSLATNITERDFNNNVNNVQATHYKIDDNNTYFDPLHHITHKGYYAGNANPTRANPSINRFNGLSPVPDGFDFGFWHGTNTKDGLENKFYHSGRPGVLKQNQSLVGVMGSTNGICEYRASNFNGKLKGNLLGASFNGILYRVALTPDGSALDNTVTHNGSGINGLIHLADGFGTWNILDVTSQSDSDIFPGTIWLAEYGRNAITVMEPVDFNQCNFSNPADSPTADFDSDGYTNADEIASGTDPCSPASSPEDWDNDKVSDLNDADDDNDGILDINDAFALDKDNGTKTNIPVEYEWEASAVPAGYILNSGFSGLMINGSANYKNLYNRDEMTVIGTGGFFTIDHTTAGTAVGNANNQEYGFQFGVNVGAYPGNFMVHTDLIQPFEGVLQSDMTDQNFGMFLGTGNQSNFLKIVADANNGVGGLRVLFENNNVILHNELHPLNIIGQEDVHLYLLIDKATNQVQPAYSIDNEPITNLGTPISVPANWLNNVAAVGIISSSGSGVPIAPTWAFFRVTPIVSTSNAVVTINSGNNIESSTDTDNSFRISNNAPDGQKITKVVIDLRTTIFPDMVFDPNNAIQDMPTAKPFTVNVGQTETGFSSFNYVDAHLGNIANGYNQLELNFNDFGQGEIFEFSIDTDPTSIKGTSATHEAGKVSGLELAGATVTVTFDDGSGHISTLYRENGQLGSSTNTLKQGSKNPVSISAIGINTIPAETTTANQTIRITGVPNEQVRLLQLEGGLFINGVPNGGFDIDAFEANRLLSIVSEQATTIGINGFVDVPITLNRTNIENVETGINYFVAVSLNQDGSTSTVSNKLTIRLKNGPPVASYRINAGGPTYTTTEGAVFAADGYFSAGNVDNPANLQIANTEDDAMYRSNRWNNAMAYNFPVSNGNYQVVLHFAEVYFGVEGRGGLNTGPGSRVFNVAIEGQPKLSNFDIFTTAGGALRAIQRTFTVAVTDGLLNINFTSVVNNAKVNAIEIIPFNGNTPPVLENPLADKTYPYDPGLTNPFSFTIPANTFSDLQDATFTYSATLENGQPLPDWLSLNSTTGEFTGYASQYQVNPNYIDVKVSAFDSQGLSASDVFRITLVDPIEFNTKRINTGKTTGTPFTSTDGKLFINDTYVTGGNTYTNGTLAIDNTTNDALYQSERYGNMTYNIPVSNGAYKVTLHFAEIYFGVTGGGGIGSRRFHVDMEGVRRLSNYDVFAKAGGASKAIQEEMYVQVTDGQLTIQFTNVTDNAKISAIEVSPFVPVLKLQQNTGQLLAGASRKPILRMEIPNFGVNIVSQITFSTRGTSNVGDIAKATLYYGNVDNFDNATLLGEVNNPSGTFIFSGLNQNLADGDNYFWLAYDVSPNASIGNVVDAECIEVSLTNATLNPNSTLPIIGRMITQTDKMPGKMLNFDGTNDFVTLPNEAKFDFTNQMTVETWIKVGTFNRNWQAIVTKGDNSWRLHRNNNTNLVNFAFNAQGGGLVQVNSTTNVNDGQWHHVAGVYTGTHLQIYVDGVKEGEVATTALIANSTYPVIIGENAQATGRYFNGQIDEVRIWSVARTQNQIRENMHLVSKGTETGLVGYWQFNQESGTIAVDLVNELSGNLSAGMSDANWENATQPVAGGISYRATTVANTDVSYNNTGIQITFGTTHPNGEIVVSRLENVSPALIDPSVGQNKTPHYWVINNYGTKIGLSPMKLRFHVPGGFLTNPNPSAYSLYKRASNSTGNWDAPILASNVNLDEEWVEFTGITGFSQAIISGTGIGLPIRLVSFKGNRLNDLEVQLEWITALEENNLGFEIEKGKNGVDFEKIGFVDGAGNSNQFITYQFNDKEAPEAAYYRLKQLDDDGKFSYSPIVFVDNGKIEKITLYPNPAQTWVEIQASENLQKLDKIRLELLSTNGTVLHQWQGDLNMLKDKINQSLGSLSDGIYILRFRADGKVYTVRLMKN